MGFLGSKLNLPRRQSQAFLCYESHIVWPCPGWGGACWGSGPPSCSPGLSPFPVAHPGPCPGSRLQHIQPLPPPAGASGSGREGLGRREWRRTEKVDKPGKKAGEMGRKVENQEAEKERRGKRQKEPSQAPARAPQAQKPIPEGVYIPRSPYSRAPHSEEQPEGWRDAKQTHWFHVCAGPGQQSALATPHHFRQHPPHSTACVSKGASVHTR